MNNYQVQEGTQSNHNLPYGSLKQPVQDFNHSQSLQNWDFTEQMPMQQQFTQQREMPMQQQFAQQREMPMQQQLRQQREMSIEQQFGQQRLMPMEQQLGQQRVMQEGENLMIIQNGEKRFTVDYMILRDRNLREKSGVSIIDDSFREMKQLRRG